jgi:hypothetical protein
MNMPFENGHPKVGGRRKGVPNRATEEVRELARSIIEDPEYQQALRARLRAGEAGGIEGLLWRYAGGAPQSTEPAADTIELKDLLEQLWQQYHSAQASAQDANSTTTRTPVPRDEQ